MAEAMKTTAPQLTGEKGRDGPVNESSHRDRLMAYLEAYEARDIEAVGGMLSDQVSLRDWDICVQGKDAALDETRKNFASVQHLKIVPLRVFESEGAVAAELQILIDGRLDLRVVDVVEFDAQGAICAIRAYKGRPGV